MHITRLQPDIATDLRADDNSESGALPLDDRLINIIADADADAATQMANIEAHASNLVDFSSPENLTALNTKLADYTIDISLKSALARKTVGTVETLIKQ